MYTYSQLMGMSKTDLQNALLPGASPKPTLPERNHITDHVTYRNDLETYAADVAAKAAAGPGGNPPGNPPPPPSVF